MTSELVREWEIAARDLGLEIVSPFALILSPGVEICFPLLLKSFGARHGMLILTDYSVVKPHTDRIADLGYGFSCLDEPSRPANQSYDRDTMIDLLSDW